jgi:imidazolonepropionase-like amidohydrolase
VSALVLRAPAAWLGPGSLVRDAAVVCERGTIAFAGPAADLPPVEVAEEREVDGFLAPAACDRHVHIGLSDPAAVLVRGTTAVRDLGWPSDVIFPMADASELPTFTGPLIRCAGPMLTAPGGYPTNDRWAPPGTGLELLGAEDAERAVSALAGRGAAAIKVSLNAEAGPTPSDAELTAICDTARTHRLPVVAHVEGKGEAERALGAGVKELAHAPWTEALSDSTVQALAKRVRMISTLDVHTVGGDTPRLRCALDNLRRFHDAGGTVVYGTDLGNGPIPPGVDAQEVALLREAGLSVDQILEAMVRAPLAKGAPADLVAFGADPFDDLSAVDDVRLVVRAGRIVA